MRKYVVPIAALAGIALLSPRADAANLIIKSRVGCAGRPVSLPVAVSAPTSGTELWGVDFAIAWPTGAAIDKAVDANNNSFTPQTAGTETPVVVTGAPTVGGGTNPNLYVGYVRGTSGMPLSTKGTLAPDAGIGLLRLQVATAGAKGTTVALSVPATYNVKNDGTGNDVSRPGASGATSTATAGAAVNAETVTLYTGTLDDPALNTPAYLRVPTAQVAIDTAPQTSAPGAVGPGDLNADGLLGSADISNLAAVLNGKATQVSGFTDYKKIASDVAPLNGYTPTNIGGTAGQGYGDGVVGSADISLLAAKLGGKVNTNTTNFPVCE